MQTNLLEYLERTVVTFPDKCAFSGEDGELSFLDVYNQARSLGSALLKEGCRNQPVVVYMKKSPRTITAYLGIIYSGCFYVPLDKDMPQHRIDLILHQLQPCVCICDDATLPAARTMAHKIKCYRYNDLAFDHIDDAALKDVRSCQIDTDPVYIVFTSGSTGIPKGVTGCHRAVIDYIESLCEILPFDHTTVFGNQTPLYFDACLKEILPTLKYGATTHLIPKQLFLFPVKLVEYLNNHCINTLCWVVSTLTTISSMGTFAKIKPEHLHTIAFASEIFPIRQLKLWQSALPNASFFNLYGPTETTGICCFYKVDRNFCENEVLPIGRPFRNTQIILLSEQDRIPPPGEPGEICIRGTRLTLGYYGDWEKTASAFVQNPLNKHYPEYIYRTGDIGRYNEHGELVFLSRKDNQIKHMGHRIELGEIEAAAHIHTSVNACCCIYEHNSKQIHLYYAGSISEHSLKAHLKQRLPRYMIPHLLVQIDQIPLTPNGKIDRNYLAQRSKAYGKTDSHFA